MIRLGFFSSDINMIQTYMDKSKKLIEEGGDWDRRNRLKVYEGVYFLMARDFSSAAKLFQESVATFTATELMDYKALVFYTVLTTVLSFERVLLNDKVVKSPEIRAVLRENGLLTDFLDGFYNSQYKTFFHALVSLENEIDLDLYLSQHKRYLYRELRILSYGQFLNAYKSVTLDNMSQSFGVSAAFMDRELSRFIAAGRLPAKIDSVEGVIETNRPDNKNQQYNQVISKVMLCSIVCRSLQESSTFKM